VDEASVVEICKFLQGKGCLPSRNQKVKRGSALCHRQGNKGRGGESGGGGATENWHVHE